MSHQKKNRSKSRGGKRLSHQPAPFLRQEPGSGAEPSGRAGDIPEPALESTAAIPPIRDIPTDQEEEPAVPAAAFFPVSAQSDPAPTVWQPRPRSRRPEKHAPDWMPPTAARFWTILCRQWKELLEDIGRFGGRWRHIARENRANRFPESDRAPIQLLLFLWSLPSLWISLLGERLRRLQMGIASALGSLKGASERRRLHPLIFWGCACAVMALAVFGSMYTVGTTVSYNGHAIAAVSSREDAEAAQKNLEKITTWALGSKYSIDESLIQYDDGLMRRQELVDADTLEESLSEEIGLVVNGYSLYINGERLGSTPYAGALEQLLQQLKDQATDENTISCDFAEDVEVKAEYVPTDAIMNLGYLAETLYSTKAEEVTYTVVKGDTWSEIAEDHGMTSKELLAMNPGYDIDRIQIGEVLTMSAAVPYLTMTVVQQERYVDEVNYDVEYTDTPNLYLGDTSVISKGVFGAADVVANVTYVNGEETERTLLSSVTLREPVTEYQYRGTTPRPTWLPTGTFRWPTTGRITSRFGGRKSPGGIGSTNHKGIDIAAPRGTPVYAADGGIVTYAGWMGGYGYLVRINHNNNGYETYYGHNSSLTVSVGQHVYKGQQIARVGSTGNSTGNHCHFEVRYNGVAKNPLNYLP